MEPYEAEVVNQNNKMNAKAQQTNIAVFPTTYNIKKMYVENAEDPPVFLISQKQKGKSVKAIRIEVYCMRFLIGNLAVIWAE